MRRYGQNITLKDGQANAAKGASFESQDFTLTGFDIIAGLYEGSTFSSDAKISSKNTLIDQDSQILAGGSIDFDSEALTNNGQILSEQGITFDIYDDLENYSSKA